MFAAIRDALAREGSVSIAEFVRISTSDRPAATGRNPCIAASVVIAASRTPAFRAGKALRNAMNRGL